LVALIATQSQFAQSKFLFLEEHGQPASNRMERRMQIASIGSMPNLAAVNKTPETAEGPGPDHDGDSDDKSAVKSATAPGVGSLVDTTA
jgi:hypothetical protein